MRNFILLGAIALSLFSCKSDRSDDNQSDVSIVGNWSAYREEVYSGKTGALLTKYSRDYGDCEKKSFVEFTGDKNYTSLFYEVDSKGNCINYGQTKGTYSYDPVKKELVVKYDGETDRSTVKNLSKTNLDLEIFNDEDFDKDGTNDSYHILFKKN